MFGTLRGYEFKKRHDCNVIHGQVCAPVLWIPCVLKTMCHVFVISLRCQGCGMFEIQSVFDLVFFDFNVSWIRYVLPHIILNLMHPGFVVLEL
jgi:hypothetical protein